MAPCLYCLNYSFKDVDVTRSVLSVSVVFVNFDDLNRQAVLMSQLFYVRSATHSNDARATSAFPRDGTYSEQSGSALGTGASIGIAFGAFVLGMVVMAVILLGILRLVNQSKRI